MIESELLSIRIFLVEVIPKIEMNSKAPKFKVNDRVRIIKSIRIFLVKVIPNTCQEKYLLPIYDQSLDL